MKYSLDVHRRRSMRLQGAFHAHFFAQMTVPALTEKMPIDIITNQGAL